MANFDENQAFETEENEVTDVTPVEAEAPIAPISMEDTEKRQKKKVAVAFAGGAATGAVALWLWIKKVHPAIKKLKEEKKAERAARKAAKKAAKEPIDIDQFVDSTDDQ